MTQPADVAGVVLLRDDGAALMQHRDDKPGLRHANQWVPPGGHCDACEAIDACARREFIEETGYRLGDLQYLGVVMVREPADAPAFSVAIFWSRYDGVQPITCYEGQALEFIRRGEAGRYAIPPYLVEVWDAALAARAATFAERP